MFQLDLRVSLQRRENAGFIGSLQLSTPTRFRHTLFVSMSYRQLGNKSAGWQQIKFLARALHVNPRHAAARHQSHVSISVR